MKAKMPPRPRPQRTRPPNPIKSVKERPMASGKWCEPTPLSINIININRSQGYIHDTLGSLADSDWKYSGIPVSLVIGNEDEDHLGPYRNDPNITIVPWTLPPPRVDLRTMFVKNYVRALRHGKGHVLIFEDDVAFSRNWLAKTLQALQEMQEDKLHHFGLALYTAHDLGDKAFNRGRHYRSFYDQWFFGTQGMFYPSKVREDLAQYLEDNEERLAGDLLIREWFMHHHNSYALNGSVVQHMGGHSTGLAGAGFHRAWNLLKDL